MCVSPTCVCFGGLFLTAIDSHPATRTLRPFVSFINSLCLRARRAIRHYTRAFFPSGFQFVAAIFLRPDRLATRDGIRQGNHGDHRHPPLSPLPSHLAPVLFINDAALLIARGLNLAAYWYEPYRLNGARRLQLEPILPPAISHGESSNDSFDKLPSLSLSLSLVPISFSEFKYLERFALIYCRRMIHSFL